MTWASTFQYKAIVTPAQAGVQHRHSKFQQGVMDFRLRGNDEVLGSCGDLDLESDA